ncbi:MAG: hypothetical protein AB2A00_09935 [Myxococcota bacterium]
MLLGLLASDVGAQADSVDGQPSAVVLPVQVDGGSASAAEVSLLLTTALTSALGDVGSFSVISTEEVRALLAHEADIQAMGCSQECVAEIMGALGARLAVVSSVVSEGRRLTWAASVVDRDGMSILHRAAVSGETFRMLLTQSRDLAHAVTGKEPTALLDTPGAQQRLGFQSPRDFKEFRAYRQAHPDDTVDQALNAFLLRRNLERGGLALAEAALFISSATVVAGALMLVAVGGAVQNYISSSGGFWLVFGGVVAIPLAVWLGVMGLALTVVDAMNLGHVEVKRAGCCRDDAALADAESHNAVSRATAIAIMATGPALFGALGLAIALSLAVVAVSPWVAFYVPDVGNSGTYPATASLAQNAGWLGVTAGFLLVVLIQPVVGALLLWWPSPGVVASD